MHEAEAEAWAEALMDLSERERKAAADAAFLQGDFNGRFNR
jgi:hypothetical protein